MRQHDAPLVSVVIPCFNQAEFLDAAIQSVLSQSHTAHEAIVVDDGSTDDPASVAAQYANIALVRQPNRGRSAARNAGARAARGQFLVFLDADDRLLPGALAAGVAYLTSRPDCALAAGHRVLIDVQGQRIAAPLPVCTATHDYLTLLQTNFIMTPAAAMFRQAAFAATGGWNEALHASEDYELYLRIARRWPIACHHTVIAEYRRHGTNTSSQAALMLRSTLTVIGMQRAYACARPGGADAYHAALAGWWGFWANQLIGQIGRRLRESPFQSAVYRDVWALVRHSAPVLTSRLLRKMLRSLSGARGGRDRVALPTKGLGGGPLQRTEQGGNPPLTGEPRVHLED